MKRVLVLLALAETFNGIQMLTIEPDAQTNYTNIINFNSRKDSLSLKNVAHQENLQFINAKIETVPLFFLEQLECVWLKFTNGTVKTVFVNSKLWMMDLNNTFTEKVIIEEGQEYQLGTLLIKKSKLTQIPQNINQLKRMNRLDIIDSPIEYVSFNDFNGLDELYEINLSGNNIKHVDTNEFISFPKLFRLKLFNNQLEQLDTCRWSMPSLHELRLNNNKLVHCAVRHFYSLAILTLGSNPLNCGWLNNLQSQVARKTKYTWFGFKLTQDEWSCSEASLGVFEMHCPLLPEKMLQLDPELGIKLGHIESTLQKLDSKLNEQYNVANDIIETMYRAAMERAFKAKKHL